MNGKRQQPPVGRGSLLIYGPPKNGKTLAVFSVFKKSAALMADPNGLTSVRTHLGYQPAVPIELNNIDDPYYEARRAIGQCEELIKQRQIRAIVLDTGSVLASRIEAKEAQKTTDARRLYPPIYRQFRDLMNRMLVLPVWVVMICHESPPRYEKIAVGNAEVKFLQRKGGPGLPGVLPESVAGLFSIVVRAGRRKVKGRTEFCLRCDPLDEEWIMGDRDGCCALEQSLDLRPIMHRAMFPGAPAPQYPPLEIQVPQNS